MALSFVYGLLLLDVILTVSAQLVLRAGAHRLSGEGFSLSLIFEPFRNKFLLIGIMLYAISFFLYVFILSKLQLNIVYPISVGIMLVLITVASYVIFRESLTLPHLLGIAAILAGVLLILMPK